MDTDDGTTADSGAPPRRRRRSQRMSPVREDHRMSVSDGNGDGQETLTSGGKKEESEDELHTDEEIDEDIIDEDDYDDYSEAEPLDYDTYYSFNEDLDDVGGDGGVGCSSSGGNMFNNNDDPEYFAYECLTVEKVEKALQDQVSIVCNVAKVPFLLLRVSNKSHFPSLFQSSPSEAKMLLHLNGWATSEAIKSLPTTSTGSKGASLQQTLSSSSSSTTSSPTSSKLPPPRPPALHPLQTTETFLFCEVCAVTQASADFSHLACRHLFCKGCWENHFGHQILQGLSTSNVSSPHLTRRAALNPLCFRFVVHVFEL